MYKKENFYDLDELMDFVNQTEDYDYRPISRKIIEIITENKSRNYLNDDFEHCTEVYTKYTLIYTEEYL